MGLRPEVRAVVHTLKAGEWIAAEDRWSVVGTVIRVTPGLQVDLRVLTAGVEGVVRWCPSVWASLRRLTLLEVVAAESQECYRPNPDLRICASHHCTQLLHPNWPAPRCSDRCSGS